MAQTRVCPALRYFEAMAPLTAISISASSKTMNGALRPGSSDNFLTMPSLAAPGLADLDQARWKLNPQPIALVNARGALDCRNVPSISVIVAHRSVRAACVVTRPGVGGARMCNGGRCFVLRVCQEISESTFERVEYRFTTKSAYHIL